ncbi:MAG: hypothetical protein IV100_33595 [Myxococcales bacterium]|nr:hypothetical protein [Myxococcales bacterium]
MPGDHTPTYDEWLVMVFDHPELPNGWYEDDDEYAKAWDAESDPVAAVTYQTRLFEEPELVMRRYTPQQIGFGLNFLIHATLSFHVRAFVDPQVPLGFRVRGVRAIGNLYETLFATLIDPACSRVGVTVDSSGRRADSLGFVCFMWWDVWSNLPFFLEKQKEAERDTRPDDSVGFTSHPELVDAGWAAMKQALATKHYLCMEGALHGLGHWQFAEPETVSVIVDAFLASRPELPSDLREYALQAREGDVQ